MLENFRGTGSVISAATARCLQGTGLLFSALGSTQRLALDLDLTAAADTLEFQHLPAFFEEGLAELATIEESLVAQRPIDLWEGPGGETPGLVVRTAH